MPPSVLAASGIAATGTGAAMVSSETQDRHLDDAVRLAYELLHASRMYPGLHWCVGIFKTATGTETVIVSNDGASYIPPCVYVPRSAQVLFADPELDDSFQAKWFGWVNPTATMVAYAAERSVLDPNIELYAVAATTDPGGSSVLPARRAGVPHYQDCDSTRSPFEPTAPAPELDDSRLHRLAVISPATYDQLTDANVPPTERRSTAWDATAGAVATALAGAEPLRLEVAPVIREILGALASGTPITDEQWTALAEVRLFGKSLFMRPGFIEVEPSVDPNSTALYRAHHNLDRAVEALSLWRGDNPDYAEIVYATETSQQGGAAVAGKNIKLNPEETLGYVGKIAETMAEVSVPGPVPPPAVPASPIDVSAQRGRNSRCGEGRSVGRRTRGSRHRTQRRVRPGRGRHAGPGRQKTPPRSPRSKARSPKRVSQRSDCPQRPSVW